MPLPWLRLYTEFSSDPKIQIMAFEDQRHFVMLLCLKGNGVLDTETPSDNYRERLIAKALGLDPSSAAEAKRRLIEGGLITADWQPTAWERRQFESDSSAERVRRFREKQKGNVTETLQKRPSNAIDKIRIDTDKIQNQNTTARPKRPAPPTSAEPEWFGEFKAAYPPRAGDSGWRKALKASNARITEGHSPAEMIAGAVRYAEYVQATGAVGTEYVKQACTFLGPDKPFLLPWKPPPTKADVRLNSNVSVMEQFLRSGT